MIGLVGLDHMILKRSNTAQRRANTMKKNQIKKAVVKGTNPVKTGLTLLAGVGEILTSAKEILAPATPAFNAEGTLAQLLAESGLTREGLLAQLIKGNVITRDSLGEITGFTPLPSAPVSRAVRSAPSVIGDHDPNSSRITRDSSVTIQAYRCVPSQRKNFKGGYFVQGGEFRYNNLTGKDQFHVVIEIPFTDLYKAQDRLVQERKLLSERNAPSAPKVA
jgi:hypothetical protein